MDKAEKGGKGEKWCPGPTRGTHTQEIKYNRNYIGLGYRIYTSGIARDRLV